MTEYEQNRRAVLGLQNSQIELNQRKAKMFHALADLFVTTGYLLVGTALAGGIYLIYVMAG